MSNEPTQRITPEGIGPESKQEWVGDPTQAMPVNDVVTAPVVPTSADGGARTEVIILDSAAPPIKITPNVVTGTVFDYTEHGPINRQAELLELRELQEKDRHFRNWAIVAFLSVGALASGAVYAANHIKAPAISNSTGPSTLPPIVTTTMGEPVNVTTTAIEQSPTTVIVTGELDETCPTETTVLGTTEHKIVDGDSIFSIAGAAGITEAQLLAANSCIINPKLIQKDKALFVPPKLDPNASTTTALAETTTTAAVVDTIDPIITAPVEPITPVDAPTTTVVTETTLAPVPIDDSIISDEACATMGGLNVVFPQFDPANPVTVYSKFKEEGVPLNQVDRLINNTTIIVDFHLGRVSVSHTECMPTLDTALAYLAAAA